MNSTEISLYVATTAILALSAILFVAMVTTQTRLVRYLSPLIRAYDAALPFVIGLSILALGTVWLLTHTNFKP